MAASLWSPDKVRTQNDGKCRRWGIKDTGFKVRNKGGKLRKLKESTRSLG